MEFKREHYLEELVEINPFQLLLVFSNQGIVIDFNQNLKKWYGWEYQNIIEKPYLDICKKYNYPIKAEDFLNLLKKNLPSSQRMITHSQIDNKTITLEWQVSYSKNDKYIILNGLNITFLYCQSESQNYFREIIESKKDEFLQAALKISETANQVKTEFILNMQHDIRTPISGILGMANLLVEKEPIEDRKLDLSEMADCAKELLDYCNEIVDFSNIECNSPAIMMAPFSLNAIMNEVISIELPAAKFKNLNLSLNYDPAIPNFILGDAYRMKRILINLVSNAIKFTPKGFIRVSAILDNMDLKSRAVVIQFVIEDSGIGIPADKKEVIYERFSKIAPSNKRLYKGNGLGLRIVKQFIEELDGNISVESEVGQGTSFKIFLLFKLPLSQNIMTNLADKEINQPGAGNYKKRVLLVEDSPLVRRVEHAILKQLNCEVDLAESGEEAILRFSENKYDLIFMDIGLPGIDGFKTTEQIRKLENGASRVPIVVLTAQDTQELRAQAKALMINEFCTKPLSLAVAKQLISKSEWDNKNEEVQ